MAARLLSTVLLGFCFAHAAGQSPVGGSVPHRYLVGYRDGQLPSSSEIALQGARLLGREDRLGIAEIAGRDAASLAAMPGVALVVEDRVLSAHALQLAATADATGYRSAQGWAVREAGGFGSSSTGPWSVTRGAGVRIAILDSGIDQAHPALAPNLALNITEIDQSATTGMPSPCDDGTPQDQQGHGTWAASLAAAAMSQAPGAIVGVAPEATLLNIKVLERMPATPGDANTCAQGQASGLLSWLLRGIDAAVANHADIVSMSLGTLVDITTGDGAGVKALLDQATHRAATAGVVLIAAAGNDGFSLDNQRYLELPAQARDVLAIVASTNPACAEDLAGGATCVPGPVTLPYYSNYGAPLAALAAPGGSYPAPPSGVSGWITGACSQGKPGTLDGPPADSGHSFGCFGLGHVATVAAMGTSASAPLAAGAAALVRAAHPDWSAAAVVAALRASALPVHGMPAPVLDVTTLLLPAESHFHHVAVAVAR